MADRHSLIEVLRGARRGPVHVIDPYKVPIEEAIEKARAVEALGSPLLLIASTDNASFPEHVSPYVERLKRNTGLRLVLHFPPSRGAGFSVCPGADGVLFTAVLNSTDEYFSGASLEEARALLERSALRPEILATAALTFGQDEKSFRSVAALPTGESPEDLVRYARLIRERHFDLVYLYSRYQQIGVDVCRFFRSQIAPEQFLVVSGGVRSRRQVDAFIQAGADFVAFGGALEQEGWREVLDGIVGPSPRRGAARDGGSPGFDALVRELEAGLSGPVDASLEGRRVHATNFGGLVRKMPVAVVRVTRESDVVHALRVTRRAGVPVSVRGAGHSFGAQGLVEGGVALVNTLSAPDFQILEDGAVEVATRTSWGDLEEALNAQGRALPVLTNELHVSVGGTLAVGGYGEGTVAHHGQIDQVERLRLIRPDGEAVWCSPWEEAELFRFSLASLGQTGYVDRVVLRTIPYRRWTSIYIHRYDSLRQLLAASSWLAGDEAPAPDFFSGQHYQGAFITTSGLRAEEGREAGADPRDAFLRRGSWRVEKVADWPLRSLREKRRNEWDEDHYFIWSDYVVDLAHLDRFARFLEEEVLASPVYPRCAGRLLLLAVRRPEAKALFPFEPLAPSMAGLAFGFGLYFRVEKANPYLVRAVRDLHRAVLRTCLECGGRPYLAGWYELDEEDRWRIYGRGYEILRRLREEIDPNDLFNPGLLF